MGKKNIPLGLLEIKKSLKAMPSDSIKIFLKVKRPFFFHNGYAQNNKFFGREIICADVKH